MSRERDHLRKELADLTAEQATLRLRSHSGNHLDRTGALVDLGRVEREIQRISQRLMQIDDKAREEAEATAAQLNLDSRRSEREDAAFWFRRFFTTLGIANGAAFAALASGLLQADDPVKLAPVAGAAMDAFIWGALWAGSIPLWMWARLAANGVSEQRGFPAPLQPAAKGFRFLMSQLIAISAIASVIMFCLGLFTAAGAVHGLAEGKKVADARVAARAKSTHHSAQPAGSAERASP